MFMFLYIGNYIIMKHHLYLWWPISVVQRVLQRRAQPPAVPVAGCHRLP